LLYNNLLGSSRKSVEDFFNKKGIVIEQITYTSPTKVNEMYKSERVIRIRETENHGVLLVVAMFPDYSIIQ